MRAPGASLSVVRASLSRTLRRLWAQGFVELYSGWTETFSELKDRNTKRATEVRRDAEGEYQGYLSWLRGLAALTGGQVKAKYESPEALCCSLEKRAARVPRGRIKSVRLTEAGRAVNSLRGAGVNREPHDCSPARGERITGTATAVEKDES